MTTYYVRKSGSDAAAGTSAGAAWATIGKAVGASGIASGDTVYIGAGIYRESVTVSVAPTGTTNVIGDVDGAKTGDAGEVRWLGTADDFVSSSARPLNLNTKSFLSFSNLVLQSGNISTVTNIGGHDNTFTNCHFQQGSTIALTATVDTASNLTFDRCSFLAWNSVSGAMVITLPTSATADYDVNILFRNCLFLTVGAAVDVTASGANSFKGGGVDLRSCTLITRASCVSTSSANVSTSIPCTVYDCLLITASIGAVNANTSGQIVEDYNFLSTSQTLRNNVTAGTHSNTNATQGGSILFHMGQERIWGGQPRPFGAPVRDSLAHGWGAFAGGPSVDILNRPRPSGTNRVLFTGTATAGAATTLTDGGATWGVSQLVSAVCKITGGTGSGQTKIIKSHTGTVLTFYCNWSTTPDNTSTYAIYFGTPAEDVVNTGVGSATSYQASSGSWVTNMWAGFTAEVVSGTGVGQTRAVTSNISTIVNITPNWTTNPDATSRIVLYRQTSVDAVNKTAGCFERHDTAEKETGTTDAGSVGLVLTGWADHAIYIPVDATSTTISVRARYNSTHGTTNKPQVVLDTNGEIGVTTETKTMTSAADTWETLTFAAQTPSAKGWVTVRLVSRSDGATGKAFFDTLVAA